MIYSPAARVTRFALLAGFLIGTSSGWAISVVRGPYLGRPDSSSVAIVWLTDTSSDSRVDYSPDGRDWLSSSSSSPATRHVVTLKGLESGALYRYRVFSDGIPLAPESTFRAPRGAAEVSMRFGIVGDTGGADTEREIASRFADLDLDFALHTGDVVYPSGSREDYDGGFFQPFSAWLVRGAILPTIGNHDAETERAAPYLENFVLPANGVTPESRFYSFRHGDALFVCLDVETSPFGRGSPQYEWLKRQLEQPGFVWKFVYLHEPLYSSEHGNLVARLIFDPLFEAAGIDIVFAGHEHLYERTLPIREFRRSGPGIVHITEGGGGAGLDSFHRASFSAFVRSTFGYVVVEIEGDRLLLTASDASGQVFDSVVLQKASPSPPERIRSGAIAPRDTRRR